MSDKKHKCLDCSKFVSYRAKRCRDCNGIHKKIHENLKEYQRDWQRKKKYNLEPGEFDVFWQANYGKCYLCGKLMEMPQNKQGQSLDTVAIDHDHKTGIVRGLLCFSCNKGLGYFKDNIELLKKAIKYLGG